MRNLFENLNPADFCMLLEMPFPLFNGIIVKQVEENKKQQKELENIKNKTPRKR
jgi:hypothetical protein